MSEETPTLEACRAALDLVDRLLKRAIKVVERAPYWKYVDNDDWARLVIHEAGEVELEWFENTVEYDSPHLEEHSVTFPVVLLTMPEAAFEKWKEAELEKYHRVEELKKADRARQKEMSERATLLALKAKYGE